MAVMPGVPASEKWETFDIPINIISGISYQIQFISSDNGEDSSGWAIDNVVVLKEDWTGIFFFEND
jgi:hypothetical protein